MSLLKSIAEAIEEEIDSEAVAKALDSAEAMAEEKLYASELHIAKEGISLLRGNKEAIAGLTKGAALSVLASIASGDKNKALEFSQVSDLPRGRKAARVESLALHFGSAMSKRPEDLNPPCRHRGHFLRSQTCSG